MQGEPPAKASTPTGAVFLSYASEDASAAQRIADTLRAAGIAVWFDKSELRGGDVWDQKIRRQIHDCTLFVPIISHHTQQRLEGYFRLEWKLAVDRSHLMAMERAFLLPVVVDDTRDPEAVVPDAFRAVQWTHLPAGETPPVFVDRVQRVLSGEASTSTWAGAAASGAESPIGRRAPAAGWSRRVLLVGVALAVLGAGAYFAVIRPWVSKPVASAPFAPPPHSIAVLPFVNLSGDKDQEYFSDGLTEELLNSLTQISGLQVAARTSSFSFREHPDVATVARKLNVAAVLEGSVRRSSRTVRVTAQLINAVTGFHLWSKTYDRDLGDVLKLQTDIATAVANALKVTLLTDISQKIDLGGTHNPAAFDAYLTGRRIDRMATRAEEDRAAIAAYTEAIRLDPNYAMAFSARSVARIDYARFDIHDPAAAHEVFESALEDARTAINLAPELAEGYYALGSALSWGTLEFRQADAAYTRALALAPGDARILAIYSRHAAAIGRTAIAIDAGRRAIQLDPLNFHVHRTVGIGLFFAHQYADALASFKTAISLEPHYLPSYVLLGGTQYFMGAFEAARQSCEVARAGDRGQVCLAITYKKLGRNADAEGMLEKLKSTRGNDGAYDYAAIYAQWGDNAKALGWLEAAVRQRDPSLGVLKTDPDFDSLRGEPRFQAILQGLNFPE
jgi:TolB-like protein/Tfp pilus assembly protein PilF